MIDAKINFKEHLDYFFEKVVNTIGLYLLLSRWRIEARNEAAERLWPEWLTHVFTRSIILGRSSSV